MPNCGRLRRGGKCEARWRSVIFVSRSLRRGAGSGRSAGVLIRCRICSMLETNFSSLSFISLPLARKSQRVYTTICPTPRPPIIFCTDFFDFFPSLRLCLVFLLFRQFRWFHFELFLSSFQFIVILFFSFPFLFPTLHLSCSPTWKRYRARCSTSLSGCSSFSSEALGQEIVTIVSTFNLTSSIRRWRKKTFILTLTLSVNRCDFFPLCVSFFVAESVDAAASRHPQNGLWPLTLAWFTQAQLEIVFFIVTFSCGARMRTKIGKNKVINEPKERENITKIRLPWLLSIKTAEGHKMKWEERQSAAEGW